MSKWHLCNDKAFSNTDRPSSCQEHEAYLFDIHPHSLRTWGHRVDDGRTIHSHEIVQYIFYSHRAQRSQLLVLRRPQASGPEFHAVLPANPQLSHWINPFRLTLKGEHVVSQALSAWLKSACCFPRKGICQTTPDRLCHLKTSIRGQYLATSISASSGPDT